MQRRCKLYIAKAAAMAAVLPLLIYAYEYGPDAGVVGVPGESGTCNQSGCHTGTPVNGGGGNVAVAFANGLSYTPGVNQHLVVTITDPVAKRWGFELTARTQSDVTKMAGSFAPTDRYTQLICDTLADLGIWSKEQNSSTACPASQPLEYIEHTLGGYQLNQANPGKYEFDWIPPATDIGPVTIYVAANAGPGGLAQNDNCHIYTASYTLTSGSGGGAPPTIRSTQGVITAGAYGAFNNIAPGSWIEIYGSNLAPKQDQWSGPDFKPNAPTSIDGVKVTVGGQAAFIWYVLPGQLNVLVPSNVATGTQQVIVTTPFGASNPYPVTVNATQPGLLAPSNFVIGGKQYVAAIFPDGTFALPTGAIPGITSRPAKPGETVGIFGVGFGPVQPAFPAGVLATQANTLANPIQFKFGSTTAAPPAYSGLTQGYTGLYQFNVVIPTVAANNAMPLTFTLGGKAGSQSLLIAVQ